MQQFFNPRSIAVIGASKKKDKIGRIIFDQLNPKFKTYPINPSTKNIAGVKTYSSVSEIKGNIDLAIIAIPSQLVIQSVEDCGKKGIQHVIIITSGFKEIGNVRLEYELYKTLEKYNIKCMGPNCLGAFDAHSGLDSLFLPVKKLTRPKKGNISFITQSGAVGSAILDLFAFEEFGFAKFISYGNATNLDESDYLEFLGKDKDTKIICMYLEGIKDGQRFLKVAKNINKPIIIIKGGKSERGAKATLSHTGALAGSWQIYKGVFKQSGAIVVDSMEEMFHIAKLFQNLPKSQGKRVQVVTNGGGYGIVATDTLEKEQLPMSNLTQTSKEYLKKHVPKIVTISNPIDLVGDATNERYDIALKTVMRDANVDLILLILLHQTPNIDEGMINILKKYKNRKPLVVVSTGGEKTQKLSKEVEELGFPVFSFPEQAIKALKKWSDWY
ncbi:MAG: CoA-binding protein [Nanoarchaeota archaeon]|nr:CoA-binding protein [Nanoarchaeota archaeon]